MAEATNKQKQHTDLYTHISIAWVLTTVDLLDYHGLSETIKNHSSSMKQKILIIES